MSCAIVFVHGFLGFSQCRILGVRINYFRGLRTALEDLAAPANRVPLYFPAQPPEGTVQNRAQVLAGFIRSIPAQSIILLGHSMGGLDSRYLITHLDPERRVRALITLGTPHHGSPLARWCLDTNGPLPRYIKHGGSPGLHDLTIEAATRFNASCPDRADVFYSSYAGQRPLHQQPLWLRPLGKIISAHSGMNDGLVAVDAARWGDFRGVLEADHLELVGWSLALPRGNRPFAYQAFYRRILREALAACDE